MSKEAYNDEQKEVNVSVDLDDDEIEIDDEDVVEETEEEMDPEIAKMVQDSEERINNRISKIVEKVKDHEERLIKLERSAKTSAASANENANASEPESKPTMADNFLDATFGTVGRIMHGIVDTTSFVCSSVVDLATLGRAKRQ